MNFFRKMESDSLTRPPERCFERSERVSSTRRTRFRRRCERTILIFLLILFPQNSLPRSTPCTVTPLPPTPYRSQTIIPPRLVHSTRTEPSRHSPSRITGSQRTRQFSLIRLFRQPSRISTERAQSRSRSIAEIPRSSQTRRNSPSVPNSRSSFSFPLEIFPTCTERLREECTGSS